MTAKMGRQNLAIMQDNVVTRTMVARTLALFIFRMTEEKESQKPNKISLFDSGELLNGKVP